MPANSEEHPVASAFDLTGLPSLSSHEDLVAGACASRGITPLATLTNITFLNAPIFDRRVRAEMPVHEHSVPKAFVKQPPSYAAS